MVDKFLKRQTNSGKVIITGKRVNRGAGYSLKIPWEHHFYGDAFSCLWRKGKFDKRKIYIAWVIKINMRTENTDDIFSDYEVKVMWNVAE